MTGCPQGFIQHTIAPGDTMVSVAQQYNVPLHVVRQAFRSIIDNLWRLISQNIPLDHYIGETLCFPYIDPDELAFLDAIPDLDAYITQGTRIVVEANPEAETALLARLSAEIGKMPETLLDQPVGHIRAAYQQFHDGIAAYHAALPELDRRLQFLWFLRTRSYYTGQTDDDLPLTRDTQWRHFVWLENEGYLTYNQYSWRYFDVYGRYNLLRSLLPGILESILNQDPDNWDHAGYCRLVDMALAVGLDYDRSLCELNLSLDLPPFVDFLAELLFDIAISTFGRIPEFIITFIVHGPEDAFLNLIPFEHVAEICRTHTHCRTFDRQGD